MTGSALGERAGAEPSAIARLRDAAVPLGVLLALGLALRLIIAYALLPGSGLGFDVDSFNGWAHDLASNGPWGIYDRPGFLDYTPGYLYVLWGLGWLAQALGGPGAVPGDLLKVPPILADLGLAIGVFLLVVDLSGRRATALLAAAIVLFVPVTWIDSAIWSQVDSVGTLVLVFAVWRLGRGDDLGGTLLTTLAAIIKPQFGILIPLAAVLIIRRNLQAHRLVEAGAAGEDGDEDGAGGTRDPRRWIDDPILWAIRAVGLVCAALSLIPASLSNLQGAPALGVLAPLVGLGMAAAAGAIWYRDRQLGSGFGRLVSVALAGLGAAQVICAPFGINTLRLAINILRTGAEYPYITVNAFNPWALVSRGGSGLTLGGTWIPDATTAEHGPGLEILGVPALMIGTLLLLAAILVLGAVLWRRADRRTLIATLAVMAIAFFVLPTRVHERYMYPFFVLGAVLAARSFRWAAVYAMLAVTVTMNLLAVLDIYRQYTKGLDPLFDLFGGFGGRLMATFHSSDGATSLGITLAAVLSAAGLLGAAVLLLRPGDEEATEETEDLAAAAASPGGRGTAGSRGFETGVTGSAISRVGAGAGAWLHRARFDRSPLLAGETGGRLDRLDLWLLVVLVVASLGLRTFRLAEPFGMHFDEVYHARTATEFLQDWRYGKPHDIYEFTHPHLAKYAIAGGLVAWGNDQVVATSQLGVPVKDALVEARWDDAAIAASEGQPAEPARRGGERLYVATGSQVRVYDLLSREQLATFAVAGADALALDADGHRVFVGTSGGEILALSTDLTTDELRAQEAAAPGEGGPATFATAPAAVDHLWSVGNGGTLVAGLADGRLASFDSLDTTGVFIAAGADPGAADVIETGSFQALVVDPAAVLDRTATTAKLVELLGGSAAEYETRLASSASLVTVFSPLGSQQAAVQDAIAAGDLAGFEIRSVPRIAVADSQGVAIMDSSTVKVTSRVQMDGGATSLARVDNLDSPTLYAANGAQLTTVTLPKADTGSVTVGTKVWMPAAISRVVFDASSGLVHALGRTPDGTGWTIYVVETRGNAVFADARLPFEPAAWALDAEPTYPSDDRQQILAFDGAGASAAVSVGQHAFAWRFPGVLAGALMAALLFLLARILFRRRAIGVLVGIFGLVDGMFFVQQRIAMNDTYVSLFLMAALTLFAAIWTGAWRGRLAFWLGMPGVGVLLGLALASKWVAVYAIGALGVLILVRSALGRLVVILGLAAGTGLLGWMAVSLPADAVNGGNLIFVLVMLGLTILAAVQAVLHPIAWTVDEVRIAIAAPVAAGTVIGAATIVAHAGDRAMLLALACYAVGFVAAIGFWAGGRIGLGPLAPPPADDDPASILPPPSPAPDGWLRPGFALGIPIAWAAFSLLLIPVAVYVISYVPWALGTSNAPQIFPAGTPLIGQWPPGHTGQTLWDLTLQMYDYHNNLRATHAASSPWWAWPLDLKPVWFYQGSFAGDTSGAIYDGGNIALWWMAIPAFGFVAFQAFRRRSNALGFITVVVACMWLAWSRIDRATFEYHWYSTLPLVLLALAYFVAEIWHGPSARTWLLARVAAVAALLAPVIMWVGRGPLCGLAGVLQANKDSGALACSGAAQVTMNPSLQILGAIVILLIGGGIVVWQMLLMDRAMRAGAGPEETGPAGRRIVVIGVVALAVLAGAWLALPSAPLFSESSPPGIPSEILALLLLLVLGPLAWIAATARSPRRFVAGLIAVATVLFVAFYPNWSGLPLPSAFFNYYQALLPSWNYAFQFNVNRNEPFAVSFGSPWPLILGAVAILAAAIVAWVAWQWRIALAERAADESLLGAEGL